MESYTDLAVGASPPARPDSDPALNPTKTEELAKNIVDYDINLADAAKNYAPSDLSSPSPTRIEAPDDGRSARDAAPADHPKEIDPLAPENIEKILVEYRRLGFRVITNCQPLFDPEGKPLNAKIKDGKVLCECSSKARSHTVEGLCNKPGKAPTAGDWVNKSKDGINDLVAHYRWFKRTFSPKVNIGIAMGDSGPLGNLIALDVDVGGLAEFERWTAEHGQIDTLKNITGSGGFHLILRVPKGKNYKNAVKIHNSGIDIRAEGGQIIVFPSLHISGKQYIWANSKVFQDDAITNAIKDAPAWLLEKLKDNEIKENNEEEKKTKEKDNAGVNTDSNKISKEEIRSYVEGKIKKELQNLIKAIKAGKTNKLEKSSVRVYRLGLYFPDIFAALDNNLREVAKTDPKAVLADIDVIINKAKKEASKQGLATDLTQLISGKIDSLPAGKRKIIIKHDGELEQPIKEGLAALQTDQEIYARNGKLVRIAQYEKDEEIDGILRQKGTRRIVNLSNSDIMLRLSVAANWVEIKRVTTDEETKYKELRVYPPGFVSSFISSHIGFPEFRQLTSITRSPIVRPNGSISLAAGYDAETRLYYAPNSTVEPIKDAPTKDDAIKAAEEILDVISDFPFSDPTGKAGWLAALLSVVAIGAYKELSCAPMFVFTASTAGSGKSLLADAISLIANGETMPRSAYVFEDEEMRKRITAHVLCGDSVALIDNVKNGCAIGWPSLDAALTGRMINDRILGKTEMVTMPHQIVWFATGNNPSLQEDAARRVIIIRLEPKEERPERRTGFKYDPLPNCILRNRPRLLSQALTILSAHAAVGRPNPDGNLGSFEGWSTVVRGAVNFCGLPDPCSLLGSNTFEADPESLAHAQLLKTFHELDPRGEGLTAKEFLDSLECRADCGDGKQAAIELAKNKKNEINATSLGYLLRKLKGRIRKVENMNLSFEHAETRTRANSIKWVVKRIKI